jgi:hypothetical protein
MRGEMRQGRGEKGHTNSITWTTALTINIPSSLNDLEGKDAVSLICYLEISSRMSSTTIASLEGCLFFVTI